MRPEVLFLRDYEQNLSKTEKLDYYTTYVECDNCGVSRKSIAILSGIRVNTILEKYIVICNNCKCIANNTKLKPNGALDILPDAH